MEGSKPGFFVAEEGLFTSYYGTSLRARRKVCVRIPKCSNHDFTGGKCSNLKRSCGAMIWFNTFNRAYNGSGRWWNWEKMSCARAMVSAYIVDGSKSAVRR